ncbi:hypothetical protein [Tenebrionicola larvae]|uniref:hypothetical protein n=2 Tax=Enterobacteriaceae TaxID=543 RepID=UPI00201EE69A|nr:hypothetical protein [Tenebrionicola larvae]
MKKVLVFFNARPATVRTVPDEATTVQEHYPNGEIREMQIMIARLFSPNGECRELFIAADRDISQKDLLCASDKLN